MSDIQAFMILALLFLRQVKVIFSSFLLRVDSLVGPHGRQRLPARPLKWLVKFRVLMRRVLAEER
jgi:hypothetical protein